MNDQERMGLILRKKGLIDKLILTAQNLQQDRRLADTLMWMYSCLVSKELTLEVTTQEQIVLWANELHLTTQTESSRLELGWVLYNYMRGEDSTNKKYNMVLSLNLDAEFWATILYGDIGLSSFWISTKLLSCLIVHKDYQSLYISVGSMDRLMQQLSDQILINEVDEAMYAAERICLLDLIKQWLSSFHAQDDHFRLVLQRVDCFVKIIQCTQNFVELQGVYELLSIFIDRYPDQQELSLQMAWNSGLFSGLLGRFDQTNNKSSTATTIAGLICLETLLNLGELIEYQGDGMSNMQHNNMHHLGDQRGNIFKEECLKVTEYDYLEQLQLSQVPEVAKLAKTIVNKYFESL